MNENNPTFKSFNHPHVSAEDLPPLLAGIFAGKQLFPNLAEDDLRETSKFWEIPNIAGLAAHPAQRSAPAGLGIEARQGGAELADGVLRALHWEMTRYPGVVVAGELAGAGGRPFRVAVIVPQHYTQLAQGMKRMLWPLPESSASLDYALFIWPEALYRKNGGLVAEHFVGHWPDDQTGVIIGYDELWPVARMLEAAARRRWEADLPEARVTRPGEGFATLCAEDGQAEGALFHAAGPEDALGATTLPAFWDVLLIESATLTPVWVNPLLPAALLAGAPEWRAAALAIGALPIGVKVDPEGRFPALHGEGSGAASLPDWRDSEAVSREGWVVIPRSAVPAPCLPEARRYQKRP